MTDSAFKIEYIEYLDRNGTLKQSLPKGIADREALIKIYRTMVLTRVFDLAAINLQRTGAMGTYPSGEGQEAIGTAIGTAMLEHDVFVPYYRDVATQIQRGVLLEEILLYWGGDERGSAFKHQPEDFPLCVPIATQSCHAVGIAFAIKYRKQPRVVLTTCGDGATSKGDFYESINIAGAMNLPLVFVVNNNQWAISVSRDQQTASKTIAQKAFAAGFGGIQVDGNDPLAVFQVVQEALELARNQHRPTLIEAITYRLGDHTTADDASRYREQQDLENARQLEPLIRFKSFISKEFEWIEKDDKELYDDCKQQVKIAAENYQETTEQKPGEFFDYMFEKPTMNLIQQKEEFLDGEKRHG